MKTSFTGLVGLCLILFAICSFAAEAGDGTAVAATFQERTSFPGQSADVQVVFLDNSITTLAFRVYDSALLDNQFEKGTFDGQPHDKPRIDPGATPDNAYRDNVKLTLNTSSNITVGKWKVIPVYQTKSGARIYYIVDSYKENGDSKRFSFLVQPPSVK